MRTLLLLLVSATVASSADRGFDGVARMMIDQTMCHLQIDEETFRAEINRTSRSQGMAFSEVVDRASVVAAATWDAIPNKQGYCLSRQ